MYKLRVFGLSLLLVLSNPLMAQEIDWIDIYSPAPWVPFAFIDYQGMVSDAERGDVQAIEQIRVNKLRLSPPRSRDTRKIAIAQFLEDSTLDKDVLQTVAQNISTDDRQLAQYKRTMTEKGLNPENIADAVTALTLSSYSLQTYGITGLERVSVQSVRVVQAMVTEEIVTMLPASVEAVDLQLGRAELELEYLFQTQLMLHAVQAGSDANASIRNLLIERAENKTGMNVSELGL